MRLHRKRPPAGDAAQAISQAVTAAAAASERLASASQVRAGADAQAAHEQDTIISELRAMRQRNHLADVILDSVHRRGGQGS